MPPQLPPESHYDPKKLQKIFAIATIVLLISLVGLFAKDYSRQWKDYQRKFRVMEVEKSRVKLDAESNELAKNDEYQKVLKELKAAQEKAESQNSALATVKKKVASLEAVKKLHVQKSQFAKAEYDALKYTYEEAAHKKAADAAKIKIQLDTLGNKINDLQIQIDADDAAIKTQNEILKNAEKEVKDLDKKRATIAKKAGIIERKLKRIDLQEMSAANQLAEVVRDLPLIDLANPNYKIRQIVLSDIPEDVNFMKVPRVDRCTTCHLGIDNPDFKDVGQPFATHPHLEMFVDKNSPHPVEEFACTTCHMGRGRATDFVSAAHTPRDEEQRKLWEKKYGWKALSHWQQPMLPAPLTEAGCFKCHQDQTVLKGAQKLNLGLNLIERAGCYGCHTIAKYKDWFKTGPSLEFLASKTTKEWAYHWIENPKAIRHNTWMPSYFNQSNNNDPASIKRGQQEIHAMVGFLFANSKPFTVDASAEKGDPVKGKELVASLGCMACHQVQPEKKAVKRDSNQLHREFGPNLIGLGSKTSQAWLFDWLKNPDRYHPESKMPNMRLSDDEAAAIAAYLVQDTSSVVSKPVPAVDDKVLDSIVFDFLKKNESIESSKAKIKAMTQDEKFQFAGHRLVREYGCFSCHKIPGFENEKPIGVELTEEGTKSVERLDFGFVKIEHAKPAWFKQKLLDPRSFDHGRVREPLEKLKMPNFNFTDEEAVAVTAALMSFVKDRPNASKMAGHGVKNAFINDGQKAIRQFNCQACHIIAGEGGAVKPTVIDWLTTHEGKDATEAKSLLDAYAPPDLIGEGAKVQADWLFNFLKSPNIIRPWYKMRMPTYGFHAAEANTIVKYFNYMDGEEFPFTDMYHANMSKEEFTAAAHMVSPEVFDCAKCHVFGTQMPNGTPDSWGPDLFQSNRLKPDWIEKWIANPPALKPSTKMPTFFDPNDFDNAGPPDVLNGDERRQIKALRDYLLTISSNPELHKIEAAPSKAEKAEAPKAEAPVAQSAPASK